MQHVVLKRMVTVTIVFLLLSDSEKVGQPWVKLRKGEGISLEPVSFLE